MSILVFFLSFIIFSQEKDDGKISINDLNFKSTTNPAFTLLEETPTAINIPDNLRSLAVYLYNGFNSNNIALEINPYWAFSLHKKDESYLEYLGIDKKGPFKYIRSNTSFSLAYTQKKFEEHLEDRKAIALGLRTSFIKIFSKARKAKIKDVILEIKEGFKDIDIENFDKKIRGDRENSIDTSPDIIICGKNDIENLKFEVIYKEEAKKYLKEIKLNNIKKFLIDKNFKEPSQDEIKIFLIEKNIKDPTENEVNQFLKRYFEQSCRVLKKFYYSEKNIKPNLRIDGALGYSLLSKNSNFSSDLRNRLGVWLTFDFAIDLKSKERDLSENTNYFHFFGIVKHINDGFSQDTNQNYIRTSFWDYGVKLAFDLNKFNISYEYLKRSGNDSKFRSVGNLTYQVSKKISLTGGFGKDFALQDNLVSLFGINWGIDSGEKSLNK